MSLSGRWTLALCVLCLLAGSLGCREKPQEHELESEVAETTEALEEAASFEHLLVIMIDTLRLDHLKTYGYERDTAPFLDRLAREGRAVRSLSASSWTRSSVTTLLSGLPPQIHQTFGRNDVLPESLPWLPAILDHEGFATLAFIGNLNVGRRWGFDRGFDLYRQTSPDGKVDGATVTNVALGMAEELGDERRLLYLHYVDPHDPYHPEQPFADDPEQHPWTQPRRLRKQGKPYPDDALLALIDQYDGEILELDRELARLLSGLDERGLLDDTLVVVISDHGEEFGEHGGLTHGRTLFREVVEVPMILWSKEGLGPTSVANQSSDSETSASHPIVGWFAHRDFVSTVLEALDVDYQTDQTLDPSLGPSRWRAILAGELPMTSVDLHLDIDGLGLLARVEGSEKVLYTNSRRSLFDLERDPLELDPLPISPAGPGYELLESLIEDHNADTKLRFDVISLSPDEETRGGLIALGYLDADAPVDDRETSRRNLDAWIYLRP